jgi:hypothetical protein
MDTDIASIVRELKDRQEIYDCLVRYCRGVDRLDRALLASAYHPDAIDDHGLYVGPVGGFIDWVFDLHGTHQVRTQHIITNHFCDLVGDTAHAETYHIMRSLNRQAPFHFTNHGRYVDRFERREGRWAIAARVCVVDIRDERLDPEGRAGDGQFQSPARDRTDPSYRRSTFSDPARFTV